MLLIRSHVFRGVFRPDSGETNRPLHVRTGSIPRESGIVGGWCSAWCSGGVTRDAICQPKVMIISAGITCVWYS